MQISTSSTLGSSARHRPARKASYSAWFLDVRKDKDNETSTRVPSPFLRMIPDPFLVELEAASTKMVYSRAPGVGGYGKSFKRQSRPILIL